MLCGQPAPISQQNGPPMTMGPYSSGPNSLQHVMHHPPPPPPHPIQHAGGPPPGHMQPPPPHGSFPMNPRRHPPFFPEVRQPEFRIFEMNKRLQQRTDDSDNLWWDAFANEFFEDDATLSLAICLEDGPKRYTIGRTLIPRYFRSIFEGGVSDMQITLRQPKETFHNTSITLDCDQASILTYHGKSINYKNMAHYPPNESLKDPMVKDNTVVVCTDGRLVLEFTYDDLTRIKSWHFSTRIHHELLSKSFIAMQGQDPAALDQMTKNITRQGLTNSTLNYLRLCVILEAMQELMARHKTFGIGPRDCLKTTLFQKWQRMVAPPENTRPPSKRRKRKSSTNTGGTAASKKKNNQNNMSPVPPPFTLATQDVMVVGEPSLMGGEFGDEDERLITRLENNQFDPNGVKLEDNDDFSSLGSSVSANASGSNSAGIIGPPGTNGGIPSWPTGNSNPGGNNGGGSNQSGNGPNNGQNAQDDSKKQSPNLSQ